MWLFLLFGLLAALVVASLLLTYVVQEIPRRPVVDPPDWGNIADVRIPAIDGRLLEVWRVEPAGGSRGIVLLMHGWGRNRDRMVSRARLFGRMGFTTVLPSARDHGGSTSCRFMNAMKFAEDIEAVQRWVDAPIILYGHSAGSGGAIIAAARNPQAVRLLLLEGVYVRTREALLSLYTWVNPLFGRVCGPVILFWLNLFYRGRLDEIDPCRLAREVRVPVMLVHGARDRRFPAAFARRLQACFRPGQAALFIAPQAGHSDASASPEYPVVIQGFVDAHWPPPTGRKPPSAA
jgi:pimeloyl-ACP methyl ester carboxylesterase